MAVALNVTGQPNLLNGMPPAVTTVAGGSGASYTSPPFMVGSWSGPGAATVNVEGAYANVGQLKDTFNVVAAPAVGTAPSREYIRLGGRVIAIENPPAVVAAPVMSPAPGAYSAGQSVTLTAAAGATIYYSINGGAATQYTAAIPVTTNAATTTITAYAVVSGVSSATASGIYAINVAGLEPGWGLTKQSGAPRRVLWAAMKEVAGVTAGGDHGAGRYLKPMPVMRQSGALAGHAARASRDANLAVTVRYQELFTMRPAGVDGAAI
jgi:hypothetical protein